MDKEKILSELTDKLGKTSLSTRTLESYVSEFMPAEGNDPDEAWYERGVNFLNALQGQYNSDVAKFKKDYEQSHPAAVDKADEPKAGPAAGDDSLNKAIAELRAAHDELRKQVDADRDTRRRGALVDELREAMRRDGATDAYVLNNVLRNADLADVTDVADTARRLLAVYDKELIEARGETATPRGGGNAGTRTASEVDAYFAAKKKRLGIK